VRDKIEWMLTELSADGYDADNNDVAYVLNMREDCDIEYEPGFIDYVLELDQEWHQM